ncbi:MAG TPA: alpha/beta hydrolase [Micrococcales bacterium]|uniref:alpha/beta hydrolase n=1 Tax=Miniimonas arenae TaxID=676201 RepID=UPI000EE00A49|nr:alpha/beta fold hydrolase [Miniimonas arenae]HCX86034.1 alpha/beta hydrolase [Micrococcales bacterium]
MTSADEARTLRGPGLVASRVTRVGSPRVGPRRVVLVHGVRTSASMWRHQVAALTTAGYRPVAVDLPGHGTRAGEPFTLAAADEVITGAAAADAETEVGAAREGGLAVVGLSLGGYVALHWAARTTHPPAALVLSSCTALTGGLAHGGFVALSRGITALPRDGARRVSDVAARLAVGVAGARDIAAGGVAVPAQVPTLLALRGLDPLADLAAVLDRGIAVTFVQGEWDHFRIDERAFRRAAARRARWVVVRRAHHLVSLHRPRAYTRALLDALGRVDGDRAGDEPGPVP